MRQFTFFIIVNEDGSHRFWGQSVGTYTSDICNILTSYGHNISELNRLKDEIKEESNRTEVSEIGINYWGFKINGAFCEFKKDEFNRETKLPTSLVIEYINKAIDFRKKYESGKIPGLVPIHLKDDWVCVPKSFLKPEHL